MDSRHFELASVKDVLSLKQSTNKLDCVSINAETLMQSGVFRHALKYSLWHLELDGRIEIKTSHHKSYEFSGDRIDYWQVSREAFKSLGNDVECIECKPKMGSLILQKKQERYQNNGITFGIVFSGGEDEVDKLLSSLDKIRDSILFSDITDYEVMVCGPSSHDPASWLVNFKSINVIYLEFDFTETKRLLIGLKKNFILQKARFNVVVVSHTRILFSKSFVKQIMKKKFDLCTTKVLGDYSEVYDRYLDIGLIGSYNLTKPNSARTLCASRLVENYLYYLSRRVAYLDGGLSIFNKNILPIDPFHPDVGWGEAEDVELAALLSEQGYLIDINEDIESYSSVVKFNRGTSIHRFYNKIYSLVDRLMWSKK